jgi:hypothetical protein
MAAYTAALDGRDPNNVEIAEPLPAIFNTMPDIEIDENRRGAEVIRRT